MTETSFPWDGTSTGDATTAPYDAGTEWGKLMALVSKSWNDASKGLTIDGLTATLPGGGIVRIAAGNALVYGTAYSNDANVDVSIPTPATSTRIDRIVLRKSWAAQTIRLVRLIGVEGGSAPALTQTVGVTWEYAVVQASITTGGVITLTDLRSVAVPEIHNHGGNTQGGTVNHSSLGSIGVNDHHNRDHAATHSNGGADAVSHDNLTGGTAAVAHGATGAVVGTTNNQTLTNKVIDDPSITNIASVSNGSVTLPAVASSSGKIRLYKALGGTYTINRNGSDTLYGPGSTGTVTSFQLLDGESVTMYNNGSGWLVF